MDKHVSIKLKFCLITLLFGFFILSSKLVLATDYYVAGDTGLDTNSGNSSLPWKTIQKAADTVIAGDTVNVKGGISYTGSNSCGSPYTAVICLTRSGTAESFISFQSWSGTGIPTINAAGAFFRYGFGVNLSGSGVNYIKINGFIIKDAYYGIVGIGIGNIFINNVIYDTATYTTAGIVTTSESSSSYVYNNTIFNTLIGIYAGQGQTIAKNNIVLNARYQGFTISSGMYVSLVMDYNNVYNTTGGNNYPVGILVREGHDLSVDPQFENTEGYDFRLKSTSVLVDAGINLPDVSSDIDNTSRPQGNKFDMGAYESDYTQILPPNAIPATFYTSPSNLMTLLAQYTGEMTQSQFAMQNTYSSLYVGDINTDGYDDVLVGGRHTVPNGGFYAFFGKTTPTNTEALNANVIIRGTISGSRISDNVSMGDIDGDGKNELLITDYNAFKAYIFKTGTGFSSTDVSTTNATISGPNHFGVGSAILGDVNGDGYDDYIVYADTGKKAYLFYGSPTIGDKSYTEANVVYSVDADISFTRPGDVSGDGLKDIVISCAGCNSGHGAIYIFYGSSNLTNKTLSQADVIISGDSYPYSLGTWSALSDVNGDGIDDIITVNGSKTFVFFGSNTLTNKTSINANVTISNGIQFTESSGPGFSVESADINNDIYKDLIVTDYWIPRTYVFFGPLTTSKTTDQADLVYDYRETQKGYVGGPIATGDVNNDGYIDIITGDGQYNQRTGKVWLFTSPHGTPSISLNNMGNTNNLTITGSVSDTLTVGGVEVSTDNGSWNTCTVSSGNFTCSLSSTLSDGSHSLRLRSKNSLGVYMATREYTTANFTYDKTSPQVDWTDTSGNKKKYESTGNDNVFTTDQLPTFNFTKSSDTTSGLSKYQILVNDNLYIDSIDPTKPSDKDYREDDDKYVKYDGNNNISVHAKKDKDRLTSGKAYKWKIRAIDSAGNSTDTQEKILRVNTHEANFSNTWFPLTLLNIGGKNINFSSIASDKIPSSLNINSTTPTFYGIAPVGTKVTLKIEKENDSNTGRDLVLSTTSSANESSRFGINVTDKLNTKTEYFINLSSVNPQGDYVELPEFKLNVGGSNILQNIEEIFKPKEKVPTPTKKGNSILDSRLRGNDTKNKQKHCFLFICW